MKFMSILTTKLRGWHIIYIYYIKQRKKSICQIISINPYSHQII